MNLHCFISMKYKFLVLLLLLIVVSATWSAPAHSQSKIKNKSQKIKTKNNTTLTLITEGKRKFEVRSTLVEKGDRRSAYNVTVSNIGDGPMYFWTNGSGISPERFSARVKNRQFCKTIQCIGGSHAGFRVPSEISPGDGIVLDVFQMILSGGTRPLNKGENVTQKIYVYNLPSKDTKLHFIVDIGYSIPPYIGPACPKEFKEWETKAKSKKLPVTVQFL